MGLAGQTSEGTKHNGSFFISAAKLTTRPPCSRWQICPDVCAEEVSLSKTHATRLPVHSRALVTTIYRMRLTHCRYDIQKQGRRSITSTYRHLPSPSAIILADSMLRAPCQEVAMLTAVHQGVAKTGQIHPHHVHMEWALWLLTGMGWMGRRRGICAHEFLV